MVVKTNSYKVEFLLLKKIGSAVFDMFRLIQEESVIQTQHLLKAYNTFSALKLFWNYTSNSSVGNPYVLF